MKIKFLLQLKNNSKKILVMYNLNYYLLLFYCNIKHIQIFFLAFKTHLFGKEKYFSHLMDYYNYGYE